MLTLEDLKKEGDRYYFPDSQLLRTKETAEEILKINNFVGAKAPTDDIRSSQMAEVVDRILAIEKHLGISHNQCQCQKTLESKKRDYKNSQ